MTPTVRDPTFLRGRMKKARQFADAASLFVEDARTSGELSDAYVTLAIHSGIAAADVICVARTGQYSGGDSHSEAVALLKGADQTASKHLARLLTMKASAGYSHRPATKDDVRKAERAHGALLDLAHKELSA